MVGFRDLVGNVNILKFKYFEKATKFCEISTLLLSPCTVDKSKVEISQNFVAFSEYTNFTYPRVVFANRVYKADFAVQFCNSHKPFLVLNLLLSKPVKVKVIYPQVLSNIGLCSGTRNKFHVLYRPNFDQ